MAFSSNARVAVAFRAFPSHRFAIVLGFAFAFREATSLSVSAVLAALASFARSLTIAICVISGGDQERGRSL
jgi:hypothetical protein